MTVATAQTTRGSARAGAIGVLAAVVAAVVIWALASVLGVKWAVGFGPQTIQVTVVSVLATALLAALIGWGLFALVRRFSAKGVAIWTVAATVATLVSLLGPLTATAPVATKLTLVAMHLAVALVLIVTLRRSAAR
jgi:hypothetical protein